MRLRSWFASVVVVFLSLAGIGQAHAQGYRVPAGFPDLDQFRLVDSSRYAIMRLQQPYGQVIQFATAGRVVCFFDNRRVPVSQRQILGCQARALPGFPSLVAMAAGGPPRMCALQAVGREGSTVRPYVFSMVNGCARGGAPMTGPVSRSGGSSDPLVDVSTPVLAVGSKVTYPGGSTCAVARNNMVACVDNTNHGFVLDPRGAWTF